MIFPKNIEEKDKLTALPRPYSYSKEMKEMKATKKRVWLLSFYLALGSMVIAVLSFPALACEFTFSYDQIEAPVGSVGEIGVRVEKNHPRCTMDDALDYQFDWKRIQILGETDWEKIGPQLYEKWFQVSLSSIGEGFLKISKDCSKEGYEEALLPITVTKGGEDGVWLSALKGEYPYEFQSNIEVQKIFAKPPLEKDILKVGKIEVKLPFVPKELADYEDEVGIYYHIFEGTALPLLIISDDFFYRFDLSES